MEGGGGGEIVKGKRELGKGIIEIICKRTVFFKKRKSTVLAKNDRKFQFYTELSRAWSVWTRATLQYKYLPLTPFLLTTTLPSIDNDSWPQYTQIYLITCINTKNTFTEEKKQKHSKSFSHSASVCGQIVPYVTSPYVALIFAAILSVYHNRI